MLLPYERYHEVLLLLKIIALATAPVSAIGIANSPGHAEDLVIPNALHTRSEDKTCLKRFIDRALYIYITFSAFSVCIKTTFFLVLQYHHVEIKMLIFSFWRNTEV